MGSSGMGRGEGRGHDKYKFLAERIKIGDA
jgi:hypothetical protein